MILDSILQSQDNSQFSRNSNKLILKRKLHRCSLSNLVHRSSSVNYHPFRHHLWKKDSIIGFGWLKVPSELCFIWMDLELISLTSYSSSPVCFPMCIDTLLTKWLVCQTCVSTAKIKFGWMSTYCIFESHMCHTKKDLCFQDIIHWCVVIDNW